MRTQNFPLQSTSFIGRTHALDEVATLCATSRLVTLTGPGGSGKTRLACAASDLVCERFNDGAWFVDLAAVSDGALIDAAIASALDVLPTNDDVRGCVIDALQGGERLIVLDNCEHVLSTCAQAAADLLGSCADITILATSREPLAIAGEAVWAVPAMPIPPSTAAVDELVRFDAVELFTERARLVDRRFELSSANAGGIVRIIERLDGIPLALELAATWTRVLSPGEIASKLDDRFRLLTRGPSDAPARHRTLRAAIDWSYELLTTPEQRALGALSVFRGGFTFDAADAVCADDVDLLDALHALVDGSLVVADTSGEASRYSMLETIRAYADETLSDERRRAVRDRHLRWFTSFAERDNDGLGNEGGQQWQVRFDEDNDNLRQALAWSLDGGSITDGLELGASIAPYWFVRSRLVEGRSWLTQLIDAAERDPDIRSATDDRPPAALAMAYHQAARMAIGLGDFANARTTMERAAELVEGVQPTPRNLNLHASILDGLADLDTNEGKLDDARAMCERSVEILRSIGDRVSEGRALTRLGDIHAKQGDVAGGRALIEEAMEVSRDAGDQVAVANGTIALGNVLLGAGDLSEAQRVFEKALALCREVSSPAGVAYAWHCLGTIAAAEGDLEKAITLTTKALDQYAEVGLGDLAAGESLWTGSYHLRAGSPQRSAAAFLHAVDLAADRVGPWALEGLAEVAATSGRVAEAGLLLGAASILRETTGPPAASDDLEMIGRATSLATTGEGPEAFDAAYSSGRTSSFEESVEVARTLAMDLEAALTEQPEGGLRGPSFTSEGEVWVVGFEGRTIRVRDSKGMRHIATLVSAPGREIHVLELVAGAPDRPTPAPATDDDSFTLSGGAGGDVLDAEARAAYERRVRELQEEIEEAEGFNDTARATQLRTEFDAILDELKRATGLGGRPRKAASAAERERLNVQRTIKAAVKRIFEADRALGRHLDEAIKTGTYCSYVPT